MRTLAISLYENPFNQRMEHERDFRACWLCPRKVLFNFYSLIVVGLPDDVALQKCSFNLKSLSHVKEVDCSL